MKKLVSVVILLITLVIAGCDSSTIGDERYNKAKKLILSNLNDPDSYEMEYFKVGKYNRNIYKIKFRAKNAYNAKVIHYAYVFFDKKGNIEDYSIYFTEDSILDSIIKE